MNAGIKIITTLALVIIGGNVFGQFSANGKIEFERRTNLEKKFKGNDSPWMNKVNLKKPKIETFYLYFDDSSSLFLPSDVVDDDPRMSWMTSKNKVYQNFKADQLLEIMSFWGSELVVGDTIKERVWKMTNKRRVIAGYDCRRAIWDANDSTRIYAWYAEELMCSSGPETFNGLPGMILGLATEDGGVVYFAKEVLKDNFDVEKRIPKVKEKDKMTEAQIRKAVTEQYGGRDDFDVKQMLDEMFLW
ncbi:MAG: GLPGLI family protein [Lishizhenia sp.]